MADNIIELDRVGMTYETGSGPVEALRDINLSISGGEFVSLVGPSGCGKSTMLRAVAGLRPATAGTIMVDGTPVVKPIPKVGMIFQAAVLLKWRTILDNVLLPAELAGLSPRRYRERALELLELVGLRDFTTKRPGELSGGMQQRVALCRALLLDPPLLLMDEPFGALDAMTRDDMNLELLRVWGEATHAGERKTVLFVTHSIPEAVFLSDRVVVMSPRPGRIAEVVTIDLPRPRTVETRATQEFGQYSLHIYDTLTGRARRRAGQPAPGAGVSGIRLRLIEVERRERPNRLRMPFRFGVKTATHGRQAIVRARIRLEDGTRGRRLFGRGPRRQMVRQGPVADRRAEPPPAAQVAGTRLRCLSGCAGLNAVRAVRRPLRGPCRRLRGAAAQPTDRQLRPVADRPRHPRRAVPRHRQELLCRDGGKPRRAEGAHDIAPEVPDADVRRPLRATPGRQARSTCATLSASSIRSPTPT